VTFGRAAGAVSELLAFVLLIASANVANLVLAKTLARPQRDCYCTALGADERDRAAHLAETVGCLWRAGRSVCCCTSEHRVMVKLLADRLPRFVEVTLDTQVLGSTLVVFDFDGRACRIFLAALYAHRCKRGAETRSRGSSDAGGGKTRNVMVVSEVALSLVLLIGAGLMVRTLWELRSVKTGQQAHTSMSNIDESKPVSRCAVPTTCAPSAPRQSAAPRKRHLGDHHHVACLAAASIRAAATPLFQRLVTSVRVKRSEESIRQHARQNRNDQREHHTCVSSYFHKRGSRSAQQFHHHPMLRRASSKPSAPPATDSTTVPPKCCRTIALVGTNAVE